MAYVERKKWAEPLKDISSGGGREEDTRSREEQGVDDGVEEGHSDAAQRPTKTAKIAQKCGTGRGR